MKKWKTRMLSGILSAVMALGNAGLQAVVSAEELTPEEKLRRYVESLPELKDVSGLLDPDEIVTVKDHEFAYQEAADLARYTDNLEVVDWEKVQVTFYEAKNAYGADFSTSVPDTYKAVYYVEPYNTEHPAYRISCSITVKEPEVQPVPAEDGSSGDQEESAGEDADPDPVWEESGPAETAEAGGPEVFFPETVQEMTEPVPAETDPGNTGELIEMIPEEMSLPEETVPEIPAEGTEEPLIKENDGSEGTYPEEAGVPSEGNEDTEAVPVESSEEILEQPVDGTEETPDEDLGENPAEEPEDETEEEPEEESEEKEGFRVNISTGEELGTVLDREDGIYAEGETVSVSTDLPRGTLTAVAALQPESNVAENTADILYSEVSYNASADLFTFRMPSEDVDLQVRRDAALGTNMLAAVGNGSGDSWDDATEVEANTYYYFSDGTLHPFNTVMGTGGRDSYKYVRYTVDGKTYTVNAYCMQHSMPSPPSGTTYYQMVDLEEGGDDKYLRKALYYGYGGPGWGKKFSNRNIKTIMENYGCTTEMQSMQHYLVDYLYDGETGYGGELSQTAKDMLAEIKEALRNMPDPLLMELQPGLSATANGRETETFTWKANGAFIITVHLEDGVSLVNETTGETGTGDVQVKGGNQFHLVATTENTRALQGKYPITCNYPLDFHGMLLKLENSQDVGFGYYTDGSSMTLQVDWPDQGKISLTKTDKATGAKLAGAVYGIYSDEKCTSLIKKMPATDENGASSAEIAISAGKVYLKELKAPAGYILDHAVKEVSVSAGSTAKVAMKDEGIKGGLQIRKEGEVLTGAVPDGEGITFQYQASPLAGAEFTVTAGEEIKAADGSVAYHKGDRVGTLTTDASGQASMQDLPLGTYVVTETKAPAGYLLSGESKTVTVTETGAEPASFSDARPKVEVAVVKQDKDSHAVLSGAVFGLYADSEIKNSVGSAIVRKDTLIAKVTTGSDGRGVFAADLPVGYSYYVKELSAPSGYILNSGDVFRFTADASGSQAVIPFSHTFENEEYMGGLTIYKEGEVLTGAVVTDAGTSFQYEARRLPGAVFSVYAGSDILSGDGRVVYKAGDLIKEGLVTGADGSASLPGLYYGTYVVKETASPENYVASGESKEITISLDNPSGEASAGSTEFTNARKKVEVTVVKQDAETGSPVMGAVFGLYTDQEIKNADGSVIAGKDVLIEKIVTGDDGKGKARQDLPLNCKYYVKELQAPVGYILDDSDVYRFTASCTDGNTASFSHVFKDGEVLGRLMVYKEGEMLVGAEVTDAGTSFKYEVRKLKGAKFAVYAGADIYTAGGKQAYKKGDLVKDGLVTGDDGSVSLDNLYFGTYTVKETTAPDNYVTSGESKDVTISLDKSSGEVSPGVATFTNVRKKADVTAIKQDIETESPVSGAVFGLYTDQEIKNADGKVIVQKDVLVEKITTGADGKGTGKQDLPLNCKYYVKELQAPVGYHLDDSDVYRFTASCTEENTAHYSHAFKDAEKRGRITVYKEGEVLVGASVTDSGTAFRYEVRKLKGAKFAVYAGADIYTAGGRLAYKKGDLVKDGLVTGDDGSVSLDNLYFGTYTVKETTAPENYVASGESKDITISLDKTSGDASPGVVTFTNVRKKVEVIAVKQDTLTESPVSGAVFGLYTDQEIKNADGKVIVQKDVLVEKITTGTDGKGTGKQDIPVNCNYYLEEVQAPDRYLLNEKDIYRFTASCSKDNTARYSHTFKDEEIKAKLTIYKEGEMLTGSSVTEEGVKFIYEVKKLKGAKFAVYAASEIRSAGGKLIFKKDDLVKDGLVTGDDGSVSLEDLYLGTYLVKETGAPKDYFNKGESKEVVLSLKERSGNIVMTSATFRDERQKVKVKVIKQDADTKNPLKGGVFGIYAGEEVKTADGRTAAGKDALIAKAVTGDDGSAVFAADLPLNCSWYVKELQAPANYYRNQNDVFTFSAPYTNDREPELSFKHTFTNKRVSARIDLVKEDAETGGKPQGDAKLFNASYGLYAREDIVHPDGKNGVLYKAGDQVAVLKTDTEGKAFIKDLYLGKYYLKELVASEGYLLDKTEYDLDCSYEGDEVETVRRKALSKEAVIKQPFQLIKIKGNGKTNAELLEGAGFSAYLASSLKMVDGRYDFTGAKPVVITKDGGTEMFTDKKGYAVSIALPYGKYIVRETTTPHNFTPVEDFTVEILEDHPTEPQQWRVLVDEEFAAKLKIIKVDGDTKKPVLIPGAEFTVYDVDAEEYVEQVTTYPSTVIHKTYFTDDDGYLILPEKLLAGHYRIEEVNAPYGYVRNEGFADVLIDTNTAYRIDDVSGDPVIEVVMEDRPVKGRLVIEKAGEVLTSYDEDFGYETVPLSGAEFAIYAAEDICTPDGQLDEEGYRVRIYEKDALVGTVVTDAGGIALIEDLPMGTYRIEEVTAPFGFVLNPDPVTVVFEYQGQDTPAIEQSAAFTDDRQKVKITVEKEDIETGKKLPGAVFGLYAESGIASFDHTELLVEADTLLQEVESDGEGTAAFTLDLPNGLYYVKELKAPDGYVSSDEVLHFDASYQGQDVKKVKLKSVKKNVPTTTEFTKSDITTGTELEGAVLTILNSSGEVVEQWTSVKNSPHVVKCLTAGESYVLREELAPYGYLRAEEVVFTVEDTGEVQKVEMKDDVPTALLIISKSGEFLDDVSLWDSAMGTVGHLFDYITGGLTEVTFDVFAAEDIKAADGVSVDYFKKDDLVGTIMTDTDGTASLGDLPLGRYYVVEKETAHGYVLDGKPRYVDLTYRGQDMPIVVFDERWQNARQKISLHLIKKEKGTETGLKGAVFGLYAAEDILSKDGEVLMEKDTLIEQRMTDSEGNIDFTADLPVEGKYYLQELYAPEGYASNNEKQEFTFSYEGSSKDIVTMEFVFEDAPITVEFSKTDITTGKELPGAHLRVEDEDGMVIDEWISEEVPHVIRNLKPGHEYDLIESKPADGYATAEKVAFKVEDTGEVQKVKMEDDVTKVYISKTDITTGEELPGAKLTILDKDGNEIESWISGEEPHYIEKLPAGKYTLREETAPDGYLRAEEVPFNVKNTAEEQKVEMKDDYTKVEISKTDITTGEELPGAKLTILDKDGNEIESWTSEEKPHYIEKLPVGEYTLREDTAPEGYVRAEEVSFTVTETGEIQKAEMKDDYTKVQISKQDITTTKELSGARLTILDKDGKEVESWTFEEKPHYIERLPMGEYTLREETAPDGYLLAEKVKFTVTETGEIQLVVMKDDYTKVEISKTDITTGKELPGAKLTILDKDGKEVESWTSEEKPHYIERLPMGEYVLREETAPDGYSVAEDVKFTVKESGEIQKVEMKDASVVSPSVTGVPFVPSGGTPDVPQAAPTTAPETHPVQSAAQVRTGDDTNLAAWFLLLIIGCSVPVVVWIAKYHRKVIKDK